jgi:hypothetical protein
VTIGISSCIITPSSPQGSISCSGHRHYLGEAGPMYDNNTRFAYWIEPADSSTGTLEVGLDDGSDDTIFLKRNIQGWELASNDRRVTPGDTGIWKLITPVNVTNDSVTIGLYRLFSWTTYYLKKLNN